MANYSTYVKVMLLLPCGTLNAWDVNTSRICLQKQGQKIMTSFFRLIAKWLSVMSVLAQRHSYTRRTCSLPRFGFLVELWTYLKYFGKYIRRGKTTQLALDLGKNKLALAMKKENTFNFSQLLHEMYPKNNFSVIWMIERNKLEMHPMKHNRAYLFARQHLYFIFQLYFCPFCAECHSYQCLLPFRGFLCRILSFYHLLSLTVFFIS